MKEKNRKQNIKNFTVSRWILIGAVTIVIITLFNFASGENFLSSSSNLIWQVPSVIPSSVPILNLYPPEKMGRTKEEYITMAIEDLAQKLNVSKTSIEVIRVVEREFRDTSLGCP